MDVCTASHVVYHHVNIQAAENFRTKTNNSKTRTTRTKTYSVNIHLQQDNLFLFAVFPIFCFPLIVQFYNFARRFRTKQQSIYCIGYNVNTMQ